MRGDRTWKLRNIEYPALALFEEQIVQLGPDAFCTCSGRSEKKLISLIRSVVLLYEVANIDLALPQTSLET